MSDIFDLVENRYYLRARGFEIPSEYDDALMNTLVELGFSLECGQGKPHVMFDESYLLICPTQNTRKVIIIDKRAGATLLERKNSRILYPGNVLAVKTVTRYSLADLQYSYHRREVYTLVDIFSNIESMKSEYSYLTPTTLKD